MIDLEAVEKSRKLFEEAKAYFVEKQLQNCIIEISGKPMDQWEVYFCNSIMDIQLFRMDCWCEQIPHITISEDNNKNVYFTYNDFTISMGEVITSGEVYINELLAKKDFNFNQIKKEFFQFLKSS
jgi:hypothetical protein